MSTSAIVHVEYWIASNETNTDVHMYICTLIEFIQFIR